MWSNVEWKLTLLSFCKQRWKLYGSEHPISLSNFPSDDIRFMCFPLFYIFRSPSTWNMHPCITCREQIYADTLSLSCFFSHPLLVHLPIYFASLLLRVHVWVVTSNSVSCSYVQLYMHCSPKFIRNSATFSLSIASLYTQRKYGSTVRTITAPAGYNCKQLSLSPSSSLSLAKSLSPCMYLFVVTIVWTTDSV
jgi:hypothetical protein